MDIWSQKRFRLRRKSASPTCWPALRRPLRSWREQPQPIRPRCSARWLAAEYSGRTNRAVLRIRRFQSRCAATARFRSRLPHLYSARRQYPGLDAFYVRIGNGRALIRGGEWLRFVGIFPPAPGHRRAIQPCDDGV